ncbi:hypothetical protein R6I31_000042 [Vibrio cholerae]|uniref:hypothetical protein n=1 Tax=Vibrio cholerae TaxID=666 RepID=UPI001E629D9B|nr:hypothetical protein [Vibrio cholerae]EGQ9960031.1 hypothetical protein [Vibrio cholerae]EJL6479680.1 hypothetical protein [Vibrio cholerae]EJL6830120.1 hypothetical protein [Vibrio cholerae]EJL7007703.1 hypothetical protein [Vibrio cholerae]EKF9698726.1 hypothetical protein [Vibrio cholerae]
MSYSRKTIKANTKQRTSTVFIPEWDTEVNIKAVNVIGMTQIFNQQDAGSRLVLAVIHGLLDADGKKLLYTEKDFDEVADLHTDIVLAIGTAVMELSHGTEDQKNS